MSDFYVGWARHFGDGRNKWEQVTRRVTESKAYHLLEQYLAAHLARKEQVSGVVLPAGDTPFKLLKGGKNNESQGGLADE